MEGIKIKQTQLEMMEKEINKALAVSTVLENELGIQQETVTADVVCVIRELIRNVEGMIQSVEEENKRYGEDMENGNI
ncbi:MAG: hypothetical protein NC548_41225 [Lachnospiraceae bacterium]|nr:hypothetical protein [Lachnospiraceae bacterium]